MKRFIAFLTALLASIAMGQSVNSPFYWSGQTAKLFPTTGVYLDGNRSVRYGETTANGSNYVEVIAPTSLGSNFVMTLPAATDTFVGKSTTDVLTNKTFDANGTGNSISNIENADIKSDAAIARSKLAAGTADHVAINDGSGVLTSEAALSPARGGTGVSNNSAATLTRSGNHALTLTTSNTTSLTLPTSGTVTALGSDIDLASAEITGILGAANGGTGVANNAGETITLVGDDAITFTTSAASNVTLPTTGTLSTLAGTEAFTNKDIDGGTASNSLRITLPKNTTTNLDALTDKEGTVAYDTDLDAVVVNDGSAWAPLAEGITATGSFTATFVQGGGYSEAVSVRYQRVGNMVILSIPSFTDTATASTSIASSASDLPAALRPVAETYFPAMVLLNTAEQMGAMRIETDGTIRLYATPALGSFVSGQGAGLSPGGRHTFTYTLN